MSSRASISNHVSKKEKRSLARLAEAVKQVFSDTSDSDSSSDSDYSDSHNDLSTEAEEELLNNKEKVKKIDTFKLFMEQFKARSKLIEDLDTTGKQIQP